MDTATRPTPAMELARRAAVLTVFPVVIGVVQMFMQLADDMPWSSLPGALLSVAIAALVFLAALLLPSLALTRLKGNRYALQLNATCPACSRSQLIINTRCIQCGDAFGVPPASRVTYMGCVAGLFLFQSTLMLQPHRWLLG